MKMTNLKPYVAILILTLALAACSKKSDTPALTKENVAGTYTLASVKVKSETVPETDITSQVESCEADDQYKLNADESFNYVDAGEICNPDGSYSGTWSLSGNTLNMDGDVATVAKFDGKVLVLTHTETDNSIVYTFTVTLNKH